MRLHDVMYVGGRAVSNSTMTPYDVASVLIADGTVLVGRPPDDVSDYLDAYRDRADVMSVGRAPDGVLVAAPSLRSCVISLLARRRGERDGTDGESVEHVWHELVAEARVSGALIGAFPTDDTTAG